MKTRFVCPIAALILLLFPMAYSFHDQISRLSSSDLSLGTVIAPVDAGSKILSSLDDEVIERRFSSNLTFSMFPEEINAIVGDMFVVSVSISDVVDMYAWQVHVYFDPEIVECVDVFVPSDYVFSYAKNFTVGRALVEYNSTEFRNPLQKVTDNYVLSGDSLVGDQQTFSGSGSLCQVRFRAISAGSTSLTFNRKTSFFGTFVLDSDLHEAVPIARNCIVSVSQH